MTVRVPSCLNDVTAEWVSEFLYNVLKVPRPENEEAHNGIILLKICANVEEGLRQSCHVTAKCGSQPDVTHSLLIEIVPSDPELRDVIVRHNLFAKELLFHQELLPLLKSYAKARGRTEDIFSVPKCLYGTYDSDAGRGVIVFEDFNDQGYSLDDPLLMIIEKRRVEQVVQNLATFHGICAAYQSTEATSLEQLFPLLDEERGNAWMQEDMMHFLKDMYSTCRNFLKSIPGQEDLCQFFESKMSDPVGLQRAASSSAVLPAKKLRTVIHGDLWHNNIYFRAGREVAKKAEEVMVTDWQMCHMGTATNDLCFLLFSSTTPSFRRDHWDSTLRQYYDQFVATVRSLNVSEEQWHISYEDFLVTVRASIPISLFFCGNIQDFDIHSEAVQVRETVVAANEDDEIIEDAFRKLQRCLDLVNDDTSSPKCHLNNSASGPASLDLSPPSKSSSAEPSEFPSRGSPFGTYKDHGIQINFDRESSPEVSSDSPNVVQKELTKGRPISDDTNTNPNEESPQATSVLLPRRGLCKVPTIASETDLTRHEAMKRAEIRWRLDPRKARAMRRKLYLDLYREAANKGFI